ncbi:MAG: hypothetical protein AB1765_01280 [Candidatus Hydrogenedentota bacterium]
MRLIFYIVLFFCFTFLVALNSEVILFYYLPNKFILIPKSLLVFLPMVAASMAVAIIAFGYIRFYKKRESKLNNEINDLKQEMTLLKEKLASTGQVTQVSSTSLTQELSIEKEISFKKEMLKAITLVAFFTISILVIRFSALLFFSIFVPLSLLIATFILLKNAKDKLIKQQRIDKIGLALIDYFEGPILLILFVMSILIGYHIIIIIHLYRI